MAGEPSNPSAASTKTGDKPKKSFDNVLSNVKRAFSRKKKPVVKPVATEGPESIPETSTVAPPQVP